MPDDFRLAAGILALVLVSPASAAISAEKYLYAGKLAEAEKALAKEMEAEPESDNLHFSLGLVHFLRAFEKLSASLYEHGLRTDLAQEAADARMREWLAPHPKPKTLTHAKLYRFIQTYLDDLEKARTHLDKVRGEKFKLPLAPAKIKVDFSGLGRPVNALMLLDASGGAAKVEKETAEKFVIAFDRADAAWLCAYCHFLAFLGEAVQAFDGKDVFECHAHLLFSRVETPHKFLTEQTINIKKIKEAGSQWEALGLVADVYTLGLAMLHLPIKHPARLKKALGHLEAMTARSRQMWKWILEEKDDDREWIPGPKQTGVLQVPVTLEMVGCWLELLDEVESLLQGKKLLPFWRATKEPVGVNLRKLFTEPAKEFNVPRWVQGTAATPYLEKGAITKLAEPGMIQKIDKAFGGSRFLGFAFWFN